VIYYIISISGEKAAKEGTWDSLMGMWISTFVLTPVAIYLLIKATNDSSLLDTDWYYGKYKLLEERIAPYWLPVRNKITSSKVWGVASNIANKVRHPKLKRAK
jgi:lipopolysaccharide export system permease protein